MSQIRIHKLVPGTGYRVTYKRGEKSMTHTGTFNRRSATEVGDFLVFEPPPATGGEPGIYVPSVIRVETVDGD